MLDSFLTRAVLAGIGVALAAAPLGVFVVWRRMAYFGDASAHAAVLGVALSLAVGAPIVAGVLVVALGMGLAVSGLAGRMQAVDTTLGVLSFSALAFGVVALSLTPGPAVDLESFLFGDILAVGRADLVLIWGGAVLVAALIGWRWQALLLTTISEELAQAEGVDPRREQAVMTLALAVVVAVAIKVVGALLIGAFLLIPAATARRLATTPEAMLAGALAAGVAAVALGLWGAWRLDTPAGPSIVCAAALLFAVVRMVPRR